MTGKGNITLDDIAKGITYSNAAYLSTDRFAVLTPDVKSQRRFFDVENYTHKYLEKIKRTPFIEYRVKTMPLESYGFRKHNEMPEETPLKAGLQSPLPPTMQTPQPVHQEVQFRNPVAPVSPLPNQSPAAELRAASLTARPDRSRPQTQGGKKMHLCKTMSQLPWKVGIYHPKELYTPTQLSAKEVFARTNPFNGTCYNNMLSALSMRGSQTLGEVLQKSEEARKRLSTSLRQQRTQTFLLSQRLPPVPKSRGEPRIACIQVNKNVAKKIANVAHNKLTNGGYSRASYGGYFMH